MPTRAPGKFIAIAAPSEGFIVTLDDVGQIWTYHKRPSGEWEWVNVEPPVVIQNETPVYSDQR